MIRTSIKPTLQPFFIFMFCATLVPLHLLAQGDLMVYPKRIVFEGTGRLQELNLSNKGTDTARYVISLVEIRMKEDGSFENITVPDSGQNFADRFIRFFPHSVVLGPNESQTIKLQLLKTNDMKPGEYRSHIYLRSQTEARPLGDDSGKKDSLISIRLVPIYGMSLPLIIRSGEVTLDIQLTDLKFAMEKDTTPMLKMHMVRKGNFSFFGDITITHISKTGKTTQVCMLKGMALYAPNPARDFSLTLDKTVGVDYRKGTLVLTCAEQSIKGVKPIIEKIEL